MIKKILYWPLVLITCFVLQTTLVKAIPIFGIKPDLLIVALFILSTKTGVLSGVYTGFLIGLAQDIYSPMILGQNALSMSFIGFIAGHFNEKIIRLDPILQGLLLIILFLVNDSIAMIVQAVKLSSDMSLVLPEILYSSIPRAFYSLVFAILPFLWTSFIHPTIRR